MKKTTGLLIGVLLFLATTASDCNPPPEGFKIRTQLGIFLGGFPTIIPHRNVAIFGVMVAEFPGSTGMSGTRTQLPSFANSGDEGLYPVPDGRVPANWRIGEFSGPCTNKEMVFNIGKGATLPVLCDTTCAFIPCLAQPRFLAVPDYIEPSNPPSTITITGHDIDSTYGMPYIKYYDPNGTLVAQLQASEVAPDGSWLSGPTPDLSGVSSNSYWVVISNVTVDGTEVIGATLLYIDNGLPPPPPDPDPNPCGTPDGNGVAMPCEAY